MPTFFLVLALILPISTFAYEHSADVLSNCSKNPVTGHTEIQDAITSSHCAGYLTGIVDGIMVMQMATQTQYICIPNNYVPGDKILQDVTRWLEKNPQSGNDSARVAVFKALVAAYPCAKN